MAISIRQVVDGARDRKRGRWAAQPGAIADFLHSVFQNSELSKFKTGLLTYYEDVGVSR